MTSYDSEPRDTTWRSVNLVYILHLIGAFTALPIFIGALISHLKRGVGSPAARGHTSYQIRSFWLFVLFSMIGYATTFLLGLGLVVLFLAWAWFIYRMVIGAVRAFDQVPAPE